ncbi:MAG: hydrogenase maturation protease [Bacteroidetes bacterium]|nr:hydrogenase maturation protease [Bacteroidota bacterium]
MNKILILGIGNLLLNDEGIGIRVVNELEKQGIEGADLMDGGTAGFHLMGFIQDYPIVIVVDASLDEYPVGNVRVLNPKYAADFPKQLSAHEIGLKDLLDATCLQGNRPEFYLVAISISDFQDLGMTVSPEAEKAIPVAVKAIRELVENCLSSLT